MFKIKQIRMDKKTSTYCRKSLNLIEGTVGFSDLFQ